MPSDIAPMLGSGLVKGTADTFRLRKKWQEEYPEGEVTFTDWLKNNGIKMPNMPKQTGAGA